MGDDCDSFFGLLVSYRPLALQCSHQKGRTTQSNGSASTSEERQTFVLAVPVKLLQPYLGARTYSTSVQPVHILASIARRDRANGLLYATSPHNYSARRALRVVAVDEAEDLSAARQGRLGRVDEAALPRHRKRAA